MAVATSVIVGSMVASAAISAYSAERQSQAAEHATDVQGTAADKALAAQQEEQAYQRQQQAEALQRDAEALTYGRQTAANKDALLAPYRAIGSAGFARLGIPDPTQGGSRTGTLSSLASGPTTGIPQVPTTPTAPTPATPTTPTTPVGGGPDLQNMQSPQGQTQTSYVTMRAPNGQTGQVAPQDVPHYQAQGAQVVS